MSIREGFETELKDLKAKLETLGQMSADALAEAIDALKNQDADRALKIMDNDLKINALEEEINDMAIALIAKQQPVASDLRRIIVAIKVSTDLERVGDLAVNMAKSIIRIGDKPLIRPLVDIPRMAEMTQSMIKDVLVAFDTEDVSSAREIAARDDAVDQLYGELIKELLQLANEEPEQLGQITQLSFVCRFIERVGDHITNICENIIYLVKGKHYDLD